MHKQVISRFLALLILSPLAGYVGYRWDQQDLALIERASHEALIEYAKSLLVTSWAEAIILCLLAGGAIYSLLEVMAYLIRLAWEKTNKEEQQSNKAL